MLPRRTSMAMNGGFSSMFLVAMLGCIERLMEWLNHYAFTQIAIYGYDFKGAAKATWRLLQDVGLMPMMNNTLVQGVCYFGCFIGAAISALISVMFVKQTDLETRVKTLEAENRTADLDCFTCHATGATHPQGPQHPFTPQNRN